MYGMCAPVGARMVVDGEAGAVSGLSGAPYPRRLGRSPQRHYGGAIGWRVDNLPKARTPQIKCSLLLKHEIVDVVRPLQLLRDVRKKALTDFLVDAQARETAGE